MNKAILHTFAFPKLFDHILKVAQPRRYDCGKWLFFSYLSKAPSAFLNKLQKKNKKYVFHQRTFFLFNGVIHFKNINFLVIRKIFLKPLLCVFFSSSRLSYLTQAKLIKMQKNEKYTLFEATFVSKTCFFVRKNINVNP